MHAATLLLALTIPASGPDLTPRDATRLVRNVLPRLVAEAVVTQIGLPPPPFKPLPELKVADSTETAREFLTPYLRQYGSQIPWSELVEAEGAFVTWRRISWGYQVLYIQRGMYWVGDACIEEHLNGAPERAVLPPASDNRWQK